MKNGILICLAFCICAVSLAPAQKVTLTLTSETPEITVGKLVLINVVMTNNSSREIRCDIGYQNELDFNYKYEVLYENGQPAPRIALKSPINVSRYPCFVAPGKTTVGSGGMISQHFDFSRPGKYSIQASRSVIIAGVTETIKSNTITVTVLPLSDPAAAAGGPVMK